MHGRSRGDREVYPMSTVITRDPLHLALNGIQKACRLVRTTYGPGGRTVLLERPGREILSTTDGISVLWAYTPEHPVERVFVRILQEACHRVATCAGDGTSSTAILIEALVREGVKAIAAGEPAPVLTKRWAETKLTSNAWSRPCEDFDTLQCVTYAASHQDVSVAATIADALLHAGSCGLVELTKGMGRTHTLEVKRGYRLEEGPDSSDMIEKGETERTMEIPLVALVDDVLIEVSDIQSILEEATAHDRPLVIVSHGVYGDALRTILMNDRKLKGGAGNVVQWVTTKPSLLTHHRYPVLQDLAALSGATIYRKDLGAFQPEWFGSVQQVTFRSKSSVWVSFEEEAVFDRIEQRVEALDREIVSSGSSGDRDTWSRRRAYLAEGFVQVHIGSVVPSERKEVTARMEDALRAGQQALETGVVPGGGQIYALLAEEAPDDAMKKALQAPWELLTPIPWRYTHTPSGWDGGYTGTSWGSLWDAGIFDVEGVVDTVLEVAISAAVSILSTAVSLTRDPRHDEVVGA